MRVRRFFVVAILVAICAIPVAGSAQCPGNVCQARPARAVAGAVEAVGGVVRRVASVPVRVVQRVGARLSCGRAARQHTRAAHYASGGSCGGYQAPAASYGSSGGYQQSAPVAESYGSYGGYPSAAAPTACESSYGSTGG